MPKKPWLRMNSQTSGDKSPRRETSQSLTISHNCSVGPSRKACSSSVKFSAGSDSKRCQSGDPENSSASHQTVPASSASCSVWDTEGIERRKKSNIGPVKNFFRRPSKFIATAASHPNPASNIMVCEKNPMAILLSTNNQG